MDNFELVEHQWPYLLKMLGDEKFLQESARQMGALQRRRGIKDAGTLLRLAMIYAFCGCSLRQTAVYADLGEIASLSNVALLKRIRSAKGWLGYLVAAKLAERAATSLPKKRLRLRLLDASTVNRPGTHGTDLRLHVGVDLRTVSMDHIEITDASGGETLRRFDFSPNDLVIADRGYAHAAGIDSLVQASAQFIVRINWQNLPLYDANDGRLEVLEMLRHLPEADAGEFAVVVHHGERSIPCRLIGVRKTEAAAQNSRHKITVEATKNRRRLDPRTLESAGFTFVLTNASPEVLSASEVLELYRFRWQIELVFKRLKSILDLDQIPTKDPKTTEALLLTKLLGALLVEDITERYISFSPWGYRFEGPLAFDLAAPQNPS
jgi:Transposase DDE domain